MPPVLAVIGGSGLYSMSELHDLEQLEVSTPFGPPSDTITRGRIYETTVLFLPRHGRGHGLAPHGINYRANICAMRQLGATHVASISAVGSLREEMAPGDVVVVDQYIDRTYRRVGTFFDSQVVAHVSMADPVCAVLARAAAAAATRAGAHVHSAGTYVCIEGPQFSTRAESRLYRSWGADVIGMTALPEAKLAREAGLAYSTIAIVTDYDCWHTSEADVTVDMVVAVLRRNVELARRIIVELAYALPNVEDSPAALALRGAIITDLASLTDETRASLGWLIGDRLA
jgi:5'-methylthioadenosine phosphorylase